MVMLNMVTPEELQDDEEYQDITEDISEECGKYGSVEGIRIPRPVAKKQKKGWGSETISATEADQNRKIDEASGVGRVYVMYTDVAGAKTAMDALGGRQFGGRTILVASVSEVSTMTTGRSIAADSRTSSLATSPLLSRHCRLRRPLRRRGLSSRPRLLRLRGLWTLTRRLRTR